MKEITATDAARNFSDVLDAVEHRNETFIVKRSGRPVARIAPTATSSGSAVKKVLLAFEPDPAWAKDLQALRRQLTSEERRWNA